ncbi:hypothetical protein [uncultured Psychroserpens sp.]|uniref:hypothetical protein n=1 Tax=uncultured Psychroserpens sp. TaxID=255436 RepID=UPI0026348E0B|nr:hypothetical protein [uncultured Psychroserpens sp.]
MSFIITIKPIQNTEFDIFSNPFSEKRIGDFYCYYNSERAVHETDDFLAFVSGYLCHTGIEKSDTNLQYTKSIDHILEHWPISDDSVSGSFSLAAFNKLNRELIFCTDPIGVYPMFYSSNRNNFFVTSNFMLAAIASKSDLDEVGIVQKAVGKEFLNLGDRTILKEVKRLLPGEYIKLNPQNKTLDKVYDNTLFNITDTRRPKKKDYVNYWKDFKKEVEYALAQFNKNYLALSGGMDSRILLGALPNDLPIKCLTFGHEDNYEVKLAKRLAKLKGYDFESFYDIDLYFPDRTLLKDYVVNSESVNIASWLEILEHIEEDKTASIMLGEPCEILPARNISTLSTRKSRISKFINTIVLNKDFQLQPATDESFESWKKSRLKMYLRRYTKATIDKLDIDMDYDHLIKEVVSDYELIFKRIESHQLPYFELYDELFAWYTHGRFPIGKQTLICNQKFNGINPSLSLNILRKSSAIHPNNRLNYRFMNGLFKHIKELRPLNRVPTSQTPFIPHSAPNFLIFLVWGIRSRLDQYFIRRLLKTKNPKGRYRLLKSINWVKAYQHENLEARLDAYFSPGHLGDQYIVQQKKGIIDRRDLKRWPLTNSNILSLSSLNIEIDIIKSLIK